MREPIKDRLLLHNSQPCARDLLGIYPLMKFALVNSENSAHRDCKSTGDSTGEKASTRGKDLWQVGMHSGLCCLEEARCNLSQPEINW